MKRFFLFTTLFFLCLVMGFSAHATDVGGLILGDTTWTKAGSPYVVISNVTVIEDVTLTIEPGVTVKFNKDNALLIDGTLVAQGTDAEKIIFTSNGDATPGFWGFISFSDTSADATFDPDGNYTGGCIIQYATVQYGGSGQPVIKINLSSPFIDNSLITQNAGNGISITKGSPVISNSEIKNNSKSGIYSAGDADTILTIDNCIISNNSSSGIYAYPGAAVTIQIQNSTVSGNSASSGGGIYAYSGTIIIQNSAISGNSAINYGGGIYAISSTVTIQNSAISGNSAINYGGGIYAHPGATVTIENSTISGNSASGSSQSYGGGIYAYSATVTIQNSAISGNSAINYGGGIYAYPGAAVTIQNSTVSGNSASSGGGICADSATVTIEGNTFIDNSASSGGAIYASGTVTMKGNTIIQNTASTPFGGVVRLDGLSADSIIGGDSCEDANLIKDNTGDGVYIKGNPAFNHNDVYNNTGFSLVCGNAAGAAPIDATNCYWGTDKEAVVKAMIWDGLDDASLGLVNYNPFSTVPCKPDDVIPPAAVTDLATSDPTANSITLTWTAPGDDGDEGQAKTYDIRYSTSEITDDNWDAATQCTGEPLPKPAGEAETFTVTDLSPGTTYYFAMKTADEVPNWSDLSNVAEGTTSGGVGAVDGHVTDLSGNPIKFAIVIAIQKPAKKWTFTGPYDKRADGYYEITDLEPGTYLLIAIKKEYKAGIAKVEVEAGVTTTKDFKLKPKPAGDDEDEFTDLYANYPNPFNPDTWIPYYLSQDADVTIRIFNSAGQLVRTLHLGRQVAGIYIDKDQAAYWDGKDDLGQQVASGIYYYTLRAGNFSVTRKMVIMK